MLKNWSSSNEVIYEAGKLCSKTACTWYYILVFVFFPHIFWPLCLEPGSKLLLTFSLLYHLSSLCIAVLCSALGSGKVSWQWWGKRGEWILSGISNHQECPTAVEMQAKVKKKSIRIRFIYLFHWRGKIYTRKKPFSTFFRCPLRLRLIQTNIFYYGLKYFLRTFPVADSGVAVYKKSSLLTMIRPLEFSSSCSFFHGEVSPAQKQSEITRLPLPRRRLEWWGRWSLLPSNKKQGEREWSQVTSGGV